MTLYNTWILISIIFRPSRLPFITTFFFQHPFTLLNDQQNQQRCLFHATEVGGKGRTVYRICSMPIGLIFDSSVRRKIRVASSSVKCGLIRFHAVPPFGVQGTWILSDRRFLAADIASIIESFKQMFIQGRHFDKEENTYNISARNRAGDRLQSRELRTQTLDVFQRQGRLPNDKVL